MYIEIIILGCLMATVMTQIMVLSTEVAYMAFFLLAAMGMGVNR